MLRQTVRASSRHVHTAWIALQPLGLLSPLARHPRPGHGCFPPQFPSHRSAPPRSTRRNRRLAASARIQALEQVTTSPSFLRLCNPPSGPIRPLSSLVSARLCVVGVNPDGTFRGKRSLSRWKRCPPQRLPGHRIKREGPMSCAGLMKWSLKPNLTCSRAGRWPGGQSGELSQPVSTTTKLRRPGSPFVGGPNAFSASANAGLGPPPCRPGAGPPPSSYDLQLQP